MRAATAADVPDVEAVVAAAFAPFVRRTGIRPAPLSVDWTTALLSEPVSVAVLEGRAVGVLLLRPQPDHVLIDTVAVRPEAQGSGIGGALLARAEAVASGRPLRLYTNAAMTEALAYYPRRGFVEVGRRSEDGYDRVFFEKRLP